MASEVEDCIDEALHTGADSLDLSDCGLESLPESLGNLTHLYLYSNRLAALPESLGNLTNLTELHLAGNELAVLPESLGNLTNLTRLDLRKNGLAALPEWAERLPVIDWQ